MPDITIGPAKQDRILNGAAQVFALSGYGGASMSQIALAAGVSKGTLYNYYETKRDLFAAFVQRVCAREVTLIFDDVDPEAAPETTLRAIGQRFLRMLASPGGLLIYRMVVAEAHVFPELAETFFEAGPRRGLAALAACLAAFDAAGRLRVPDPAFAAEQFSALMQTKLLMRLRLRLCDGLDETELERVVTEGVRVFLLAHAPG